MKSKKILFYPLSFIIFVGLFYILSNAGVNAYIYPFAFGLMFALVWVNQKAWIVCPSYFLGSVLFDWSVNNIIASACTCAVLLIPYYIHVLAKKNMKVWELGIFVAISQIPKLLLSYFSGGSIYFEIASLVVGSLFFFVYVGILEPLISRGFAYKLTPLEIICGGITLAILADGLVPLWIGPFSFLKLFVSFVLLVTAYCSKAYYTVFASVIMGFGTLIAGNNPLFIAPFIIWAVIISLFKTGKKYLMPIALLLSDLVIGYYFNLYYNFNPLELISVGVAGVIFMTIPNKVYDSITRVLCTRNDRIAVKNVVNRNRELLQRRIGNLADVFGDMDRVFRKMIKKNLSPDEVKVVLREEIKRKVCLSCSEKNRCHRTYCLESEKVFNELVDVAFEKGKISLLDVPNYLNTHCNKVTTIISAVNQSCSQYKRYSELVGNIDTSKMLIADQLSGISEVMKKLSTEVQSSVSFDTVREEKIMNQLLFNEVICDDVVVYEKGTHMSEAVVVVRNEDREKDVIANVVGQVCGVKMVENEHFSATKPGWTAISLSTSPRFDCIFGVSSKIKTGSERSGDCYSVQRLEGNRFMFALCDGMGSGARAEEVSELAIGLIENFYKAGFDSELVLSSVNKLLILQREEIFSALDICVVDLMNGIADFIKMGSPNGYVLGKEEVKIVDGGALPLGAVREMVPTTRKIVTNSGDFLILMSDGIADSFEKEEDLHQCISEMNTENPQEMADNLLQEALERNNGRAIDDMSVLIVKVFEN